jgi:hypothetical protein
VKFTKLRKEQVKVGEVEVRRIAEDRSQRNEMVAEPLRPEPALDRREKDLPVETFIDRQGFRGELAEGVAPGVEPFKPGLVGLLRWIVESVTEAVVADEDRCLEGMGLQQVSPVAGDDLPQPLACPPRLFIPEAPCGTHTHCAEKHDEDDTYESSAEPHARDPGRVRSRPVVLQWS